MIDAADWNFRTVAAQNLGLHLPDQAILANDPFPGYDYLGPNIIAPSAKQVKVIEESLHDAEDDESEVESSLGSRTSGGSVYNAEDDESKVEASLETRNMEENLYDADDDADDDERERETSAGKD